MTATRDPDRLLRAWLDLMPDEAPDRAIAAVLQAAETTRQVRAFPRIGPWRHPMNRLTLISSAALVMAALLGGAYLLAGGLNSTVVPTPSAPAPGPTSIDPTTAPSTRAGVLPAPEIIWGDWLADTEGIPAIAQGAGRIQLSVDWQDGRTFWVQLSNGQTQTLHSNPVSMSDNELTLRASTSGPCSSGDVGRYRWSRSEDGLFLTLSLIGDLCAARAATFARTWVHSLGAVNDGGPGVSNAVSPAILMTLPSRRFGMGGAQAAFEISSVDDERPRISFVAIVNPLGYTDPCELVPNARFPIDRTVDAFVAYIRTLPGHSVNAVETQIDGRRAVHLEITTAGPAADCSGTSVAQFSDALAYFPEGVVSINRGDDQSLWAVEVGGDRLFVLRYATDGISDAPFTSAAERAVIDSIRFIDVLPTP